MLPSYMNYNNYGRSSSEWEDDNYRSQLWKILNSYIDIDLPEDKDHPKRKNRKIDKDIEESSVELNEFISEFTVKE